MGLASTDVPDVNAVKAWLTQGYAIINRALASKGYTIPATTSMDVWPELQGLNNLYALHLWHQARGMDTGTGEGDTQAERVLRMFHAGLSDLLASDLTTVGMSLSSTKKRRRLRTVQMRKVDGYSGTFEGSYDSYDYASE
jgi:hypothetical protein